MKSMTSSNNLIDNSFWQILCPYLPKQFVLSWSSLSGKVAAGGCDGQIRLCWQIRFCWKMPTNNWPFVCFLWIFKWEGGSWRLWWTDKIVLKRFCWKMPTNNWPFVCFLWKFKWVGCCWRLWWTDKIVLPSLTAPWYMIFLWWRYKKKKLGSLQKCTDIIH